MAQRQRHASIATGNREILVCDVRTRPVIVSINDGVAARPAVFVALCIRLDLVCTGTVEHVPIGNVAREKASGHSWLRVPAKFLDRIPTVVFVRVHLQGYAELAQISGADNPAGEFLGPSKCGKNHGRQGCNDCNDHQQFNKGKRARHAPRRPLRAAMPTKVKLRVRVQIKHVQKRTRNRATVIRKYE